MKMTFVVLALAFSHSALAVEWTELLQQDGVTFYIDRGSFTVKRGKVRLWARTFTAEDRYFDTGTASGTYNIVNSLQEFDCALRETRVLTAYFYDADDVMVYASKRPSAIEDVIPGSIRDRYYKEACAFLPKKPKSRPQAPKGYVRRT